jgi:hypothetical protein
MRLFVFWLQSLEEDDRQRKDTVFLPKSEGQELKTQLQLWKDYRYILDKEGGEYGLRQEERRQEWQDKGFLNSLWLKMTKSIPKKKIINKRKPRNTLLGYSLFFGS